MNNKIVFTLFVVLTAFLSVGAVCADDVNGDLSEVTSIVGSSILVDGEGLSIAEDSGDILSDENGDSSFDELFDEINSGRSEINLTTDYAFNDETDEDLTAGIIIVDDNLVINGNNHVIDAKNRSRIFHINASNIIINNLILKNSNSCAIILFGELNTNNVEFINCSSDIGGAIYMENSYYVSENDKFLDNYASGEGGAIYSLGSNVSIENGLFTSNNELEWGSIFADNSIVSVVNTTFVNSTSKYATAIYSSNNQISIKKSKFINLFANRTAGALGFKRVNQINIEDCEFINVSSSKNGGAIFMDILNGTATIVNCLFDNCQSEFGGAYLQLGGLSKLLNSNFTNNYAEYNGGAVYLSDANSYIENCIFTDNEVNTTFEDYPTYGGGIFSDLTTLGIRDSIFEDNSAINGSAIYCYDADYDFDNLEFNGNAYNAICTFFDKDSEISDLSGTDVIYEDDFNNTYYPSVVEGVGMELMALNNTNITELPARYDLRDENLLTPVRNQGNMGACWAFGMYGSLESVILKAMNYTADFSENNMQNSMLLYSPYAFLRYYDEKLIEGAYPTMAAAYLLSWLGAFPQDYDSYDELGKISPLLRTDDDVHIQDIVLISNFPGNSKTINNVKEAIFKYGAVYGALLSKSSADDGTPTGYFNENTSAEYIPISSVSNHAVAVVGWDDNYSKDNFILKPPADGSWIVKNSWGSDWGDEGYFYVSYYDKTLCASPNDINERFTLPIIVNTVPYTKNYQYDFSGLYDFFKERAVYSNQFESYGDDLIAAVGTYFDDEGVEYSVVIEVNDEYIYNQTGISPFAGYHTIKLDNYVSIKEGDQFSVSIISDSIPLCRNSRVHYEEKCSIAYYLDGTYEDLTESGIVACLKAYTLEDDSIMIPVSNVSDEYGQGSLFSVKVVTADGHPVCGASVEFTIDNIVYEVMTNDEGIATFEILMLNPGNYTLTATYNNQTINVTVNVNASSENNTEVQQSSDIVDLTLALHPTGNPILMMVLSALLIVGLRFNKKRF